MDDGQEYSYGNSTEPSRRREPSPRGRASSLAHLAQPANRRRGRSEDPVRRRSSHARLPRDLLVDDVDDADEEKQTILKRSLVTDLDLATIRHLERVIQNDPSLYRGDEIDQVKAMAKHRWIAMKRYLNIGDPDKEWIDLEGWIHSWIPQEEGRSAVETIARAIEKMKTSEKVRVAWMPVPPDELDNNETPGFSVVNRWPESWGKAEGMSATANG